MADTVNKIGVKQSDGTYEMKDISVDYTNVEGLFTDATVFQAVNDKNRKDITTYVAGVSKNDEDIVIINGAGNSSSVDLSMVGATSSATGEAGFVPAPKIADKDKYLKGDGTWGEVHSGEVYSGSSNINIDSNNVIDLTNTAVVPGTYGPSADVIGSNGTTISVPKLTVDAKGRVTSVGNHTYTSVNTTYNAGNGLNLTGSSFSLGNHAVSTDTYGKGNFANFGHVKVDDTYDSVVSGADAAGGVAASQNALANGYIDLKAIVDNKIIYNGNTANITLSLTDDVLTITTS